MNIVVIPARGGSKRIPRKNVREFFGRPMISWSIEAAREAACFERIVVSTDDPEIEAVARACGAEVPFRRPAELADDYTGTMAVMRHAAEWLVSAGCKPDLLCCLYATAPFVTATNLLAGLSALRASEVDYAFAITSFPYPIQRALRLSEQGRVSMYRPEHRNTRSQDLEEAYHDAGQFYWGTTTAWLEGRPVFGERSVPIVLPRCQVQDIDTWDDWFRAERLFEVMRQQG